MGAQWKQKGRELEAHKKGQVHGKLVREIIVASKLGGGEPELNARLAAAVEKAKKASVTRETIERAIKKGTGQTDEVVAFENVTYEGFGPAGGTLVFERGYLWKAEAGGDILCEVVAYRGPSRYDAGVRLGRVIPKPGP